MAQEYDDPDDNPIIKGLMGAEEKRRAGGKDEDWDKESWSERAVRMDLPARKKKKAQGQLEELEKEDY